VLLFQDQTQLQEEKQELEKKLQKAKKERQNTDGQMRELQDQLEAEQYFSVMIFSRVSFVGAQLMYNTFPKGVLNYT